MPQRTKRQHFVPQCLLRNFGEPPEHRFSIYDEARDSFRADVKPSQEFFQNFFYDRGNEIERLLDKEVEAPAAPALACLARGEVPQDLASREAVARFLTVQLGRTPAARRTTKKWIQQSMRALVTPLLEANGWDAAEAEKLSFEYDDERAWTALGLSHDFYSWPLILDLEWRVLENKTDAPFLLSDHPVAMYNRYLWDSHDPRATSLTASGAQILLPVSHSRTLFLFDSNVYLVPGQEASALAIRTEDDVRLLNDIQLRQREWLVLVPSGTKESAVRERCREVAADGLVETGASSRKGGIGGYDESRYLLATWRKQRRLERWLSFVHVSSAARGSALTFRHRDPGLVAIHEEFMRQLHERTTNV